MEIGEAQGGSQPRDQEGLLRELRTEGKAGEAERRELLCVPMVGEPAVTLKDLSGYQLGNQESGFPSKGSEERLEGFEPGVSGPVCILESSLWLVVVSGSREARSATVAQSSP